MGMALSMLSLILILNIFRRSIPSNVDHLFRRGQLISAAAYSLGHGTNDAQKTMGIIAGAFFTVPEYRYLVSDAFGKLAIPFWIVLLAHAAIGLGTLSGGWRIIHTMGSRITRLQPMGGFAAEAAGAITLFSAAHFGIPVSTTHTITGCVIGAGAARRASAVRWGVAGDVAVAWLITIPASALVAAIFYWFVSGLIVSAATAATGAVGGLGSLFAARLALGIGEGTTFPTATRAMASWVPERNWGFAQGITHSSARIGNAVTPPLIALLVTLVSWRGAFESHGGLTTILEMRPVPSRPMCAQVLPPSVDL